MSSAINAIALDAPFEIGSTAKLIVSRRTEVPPTDRIARRLRRAAGLACRQCLTIRKTTPERSTKAQMSQTALRTDVVVGLRTMSSTLVGHFSFTEQFGCGSKKRSVVFATIASAYPAATTIRSSRVCSRPDGYASNRCAKTASTIASSMCPTVKMTRSFE